jgi:superfamily II DNA/RNA helicase
MPRIFDNIDKQLLPALQETLKVAERADFCVGYFNLRGWKHLSPHVEKWAGGDESCCRLLVGMHVSPSEELRIALSHREDADGLDNQTAIREKRRIAEEFKEQLTFGVPTNDDEVSLQKLAHQIKNKKLIVKVYLRHPLHAKLYLLHRKDANNPVTGFLGSSNLTLAGLSKQGELNVDVLEHDACNKLVDWFDDRWSDRWCVDISNELIEIIDESWATERLIPPYHVYLKIAYHLAQEARAGLSEFTIPKIFSNELFDFQIAAVKIAAHHLNKRGGVMIGDVVGLGKSMMATALAKVFEEDHQTETLILCPKNLVKMWEDYVYRYRLQAKVLSLSKAISELPEKIPRYRVVIVDESHNLRNKDGKRYKAVREYIERNESHCILLSATPYNKTYIDLSSQLSLFLSEEVDIGIRPEKLISLLGGEHEFIRRHQCSVRSLAAFEKSDDADDWRDLMRLYLVRRTRGFIMQHYAKSDERGKYLLFADGSKSYFPKRIPKNLQFGSSSTKDDPYSKFYSASVVDVINSLKLPRYGLGNYVANNPKSPPTVAQGNIVQGLSRAGTRLMGFCRTNLFKRLESAGPVFLLSIERHILRNFIAIYAIENGYDIPLGTEGSQVLDTQSVDEDFDDLLSQSEDDEESTVRTDISSNISGGLRTEKAFRDRASKTFKTYSTTLKTRFKWLPSSLFMDELRKDLLEDALSLIDVLESCGDWNPANDSKLTELFKLINKTHRKEKVLVFTQFADTARYLKTQLINMGVTYIEDATGSSGDPTGLAWRFSPDSNKKNDLILENDRLRVLIATDVLSEGQNLQDAHIVVNYDLPWAIIRLIQRAGRVDRIGQKSDEIFCYSFVPVDGVEKILQLRARVRKRLKEQGEVVGSDEAFFDDEKANDQAIRDLYTEKSGILDDEGDNDVDLASYAYQIWKNAIDSDPSLEAKVEALPDIAFATKEHIETTKAPKGALVYMRTSQGNDALAWINENGESVTQSQLTILKAAACNSSTKALPRTDHHHRLTQMGLAHIIKEEKSYGGALGRPSGARFKTYERIKNHREKIGNVRDLFNTDEHVRLIERSLEDIYKYPLYQTATDTLNRQMKSGISDEELIILILSLREDGRLCLIDEKDANRESKLICSMGLA